MNENKMDPRKTAWLIGLVLLGVNLGVAWLMYEVEYKNIFSVRDYQLVEDVEHNKTTLSLQRCMAKAVLNHADNWDRVCVEAYDLPAGCGIPQSGQLRLLDGLRKEEAVCQEKYQYKAPTVKGASMDDIGHILPPKK